MSVEAIEGDFVLKNDLIEFTKVKDILGIIMKCRNDDIYNNILRIKDYSFILATTIKNKKLPGHARLTRQVIHALIHVSQMHDIGKVGIPDKVLLKPGPLTKDEFEVIKSHVIQGNSMINNIEKKLLIKDNYYLSMAKKVISTHHEWWDGSGYPMGLKGEQIPIEGRVLAVADVYDALRSKRVYKAEIDHDTVIEMMSKESGTHFDPIVIEALLHSQSRFNQVSNTSINSEEGYTPSY